MPVETYREKNLSVRIEPLRPPSQRIVETNNSPKDLEEVKEPGDAKTPVKKVKKRPSGPGQSFL